MWSIYYFNPAGDKSILANPVGWPGKVIGFEVVRSGFRDVYDMERGITEVRFDDQFEPMKYGILT